MHRAPALPHSVFQRTDQADLAFDVSETAVERLRRKRDTARAAIREVLETRSITFEDLRRWKEAAGLVMA